MIYFFLLSVIVNCIQGVYLLGHSDETARYESQIEYLESRIPKHDAKGRFIKKA